MAMEEGREKFLQALRTRFAWSEEASKDWRKEATEDMQFLIGKQWDDRNVRARTAAGRPCLTVNRLGQLVRLVSNETSRAKPGMFAHPVDSHADVTKAEVIMGIIRHIERINDASSVYGTATDYQARCGLGYFGFQTRYSRQDSFEQEVALRFFPNPLAIYGDPSSVELDGSDSQFYFVTEKVSKEEYSERWPKSEAAAGGFSSLLGGGWNSWIMSEQEIQVAEYWYYKKEFRTLVRLTTGEARWKQELLDAGHSEEDITGMTDGKRKVEFRTTHRAVTNGYEVLEEDEWPSAWIPIFPVYGEVIWVDGKKVIRGLIPDAKEPQKVLNYTFSGAMEMVALAPKAPWIAAEGQVDPDDESWINANTEAPAVLLYKPTAQTVEGEIVVPPPPQRQFAEPPIQALVGMMSLAEDGIRHSVGLHAPSLGGLSKERSGKAIQSLQDKGSLSTYHLVLNFARSVRAAVKQLIGDGQHPGLIQTVYSEPGRILRILGEDDAQKMIVLGKGDEDLPDQKIKDQPDFDGIHDLSTGLYDVSADVGQAFSTQREAAFAAISQIFQSAPELMKILGDIWLKNADFPGAREMGQRLERLVPPQAKGKEPQIPPEVQQQMQQFQEQMQALSQEVQEKTRIIETKQIENQSKESIAQFEALSKERIASIEASLEGLKIMADAYATEGGNMNTQELEQIKGSYGVMMESIKTLGKEPPKPKPPVQGAIG